MEGHPSPRATLNRRRDHNAEQIDDLEVEVEETDSLSSEQQAGIVAAGQAAITGGVNELREKVDGSLQDFRTMADLQRHVADTYAEKKFEEVDEELGLAETLGEDSVAYAAIEGTFTRIVSASVTLIIGIYIFAQISSTMPTPENNQLANATSTVTSTTGSAFTLGAVAVIVLVASVILGLVGGFGGRGRARR
ncbi:hypothetical protein [Halarchaeum salinum]|uniref:Uncharacterized protein n=1 Tax=Halarchaeum salinum TaxID=489912 RepID=A0AAV3S925_9EURY